MAELTFIRALEEQLAPDRRRILSDWRAVLLLRRAARLYSPTQRRWQKTPNSVNEVRPILERLVAGGHLREVEGLRWLYEVTAPYAQTRPLREDDVIMELHPYAALSHLYALFFHGLTEDVPAGIDVTIPTHGTGDQLPLGTTADDWQDLHLVAGRTPREVLNQPVRWHRLEPLRYFGMRVYESDGTPVRFMSPERTLLDGLLRPELCGGFAHVLRAWTRARDLLNLDLLVEYVERFDVAVLRQRVGFILDELHLQHPGVELWPARARRGSSSRLHGGQPFAPTFSERWQLSLNAPFDALHEG